MNRKLVLRRLKKGSFDDQRIRWFNRLNSFRNDKWARKIMEVRTIRRYLKDIKAKEMGMYHKTRGISRKRVKK
jgi:hypothetical protein